MASQVERCVEVGLRIGKYGELLEASQTRAHAASGDAPPTFGEEQGVAYFQVPNLGYERLRFCKSGKGGIRPWILLVVEDPRYGDGRIKNEGAQ